MIRSPCICQHALKSLPAFRDSSPLEWVKANRKLFICHSSIPLYHGHEPMSTSSRLPPSSPVKEFESIKFFASDSCGLPQERSITEEFYSQYYRIFGPRTALLGAY